MMRYLFSFFLMLFFLPLFANAKESLMVDYYTLARYEEKQVKPYVEHWRLSVNDKCSVFAQVEGDKELFEGSSFQYAIYKEKAGIDMLLYKGNIGDFLFYYSEPLPQMDWQMDESDSTICDYPCQKAEVQFRGKKWIVWYTLDIPYSDGPWKLNGLPGLILKAVDADKNYSFEAQKISWSDRKLSKIDCRDAKKTTLENYQKDYLWNCKDSHDFMRAVTGKTFKIMIGDKEWKPAPITPCLMEYVDDLKK
nr:GLPGLI family protein [uncultured Prevotella sp.]